MTKQRSSREILQASTVVVSVVLACASLTLASYEENRQCQAKKLNRWLDTGKQIKASFSVLNIRSAKSIGNIIEYKQNSETQKCIVTCKSEEERNMVVKVIDNDIPSQEREADVYQETYYIPYEPNAATYMHLSTSEHAPSRHLFITQDLSGCDIWIADSIVLDKSTGPLIVHVNSAKHKIYEEPGKNLAYKETLAKEVLAHFNTNLNKNEPKYKFYCRISYDMIEAIDYEIKEKTMKEKLKSKVKDYWKNADSEYYYTSLYWFEEYGLFYGFYDTCNTTERRYGVWQFKLKDLKSGMLKKVEYKSNQSCKLEEEIYTKLSKTCSKSRFQTDKCKFM